jgi:hypothetical protein
VANGIKLSRDEEHEREEDMWFHVFPLSGLEPSFAFSEAGAGDLI